MDPDPAATGEGRPEPVSIWIGSGTDKERELKKFLVGSVAPAAIAYGGVFPLALRFGMKPIIALYLGIVANAVIWGALRQRLNPRQERE